MSERLADCGSAAPAVSLVVIAYNMRREIPRTIQSLSPAMQRGVTASDYEILLVDNGSVEPFDIAECQRWGADLRIVRCPDARPSPAVAINLGLSMARAPLIGVLIDGARLASPGLVSGAIRGARLHPRPIVATMGFHLGPDLQARSVAAGYDADTEDRLLDRVRWTDDGYRLFEISVFAGSCSDGWFASMNESNALFLTRAMWEEIGGFEPRFESPGGGLVNLDAYRRACLLRDAQLIVLLGEGTFHQVHGGVSTNALRSPWVEFHREYVEIRGEPFRPVEIPPLYLGGVNAAVLPSIARSIAHPRPEPLESTNVRCSPMTLLRSWCRGTVASAMRGMGWSRRP